MKSVFVCGVTAFLIVFAVAVQAGEAIVEKATARLLPSGSYSFSVTLRHGDEGWDHYADGWDVLAPNGTLLGRRVLMHPHVNEQPFTRSLSGVQVPEGIREVFIQAQDKVHGKSKNLFKITLPHR
ncbi:MAG: hypothetical protein OQJ97_07480 [Rhodospirillales bacterium]|nr:hypothetical protein [Rhodospirillales bacterium]